MFDVAAPLMSALAGAKARLAGEASETSRAQTPLGDSRTESAMADVAEQAIFTEALLSATHARLAEIKGVARG